MLEKGASPLFQTDEHLTYFLTVLYSHPDFIKQDKNFEENATVNATVSATVNPTQRKILEEIEKKSSITYDQLAERLEKERTTVYRNIKKMVELNIIKRLGSDKNGYWEVNRDMLSAIGFQKAGGARSPIGFVHDVCKTPAGKTLFFLAHFAEY